MGMLDYIKDNWRDAYSPFQRYPEIYDEHYKQGMGMLTTDAPGAWDIATKPMGALMMSGIPSLYEAFRDEPIYNTLVNDLNIDKTKADYATQAIGLALDIGVPWAVMKKGMTPWISEQVAKQANPSGFSPSRRRFLQGTGAAATLAATGKGLDLLPVAKQAAKSSPNAFGLLMGKMTKSLRSVGTPLHSESLAPAYTGMQNWYSEFANLGRVLRGIGKHPEYGKPKHIRATNMQELKEFDESAISRINKQVTKEYSQGHADEMTGNLNFHYDNISKAKNLYDANPKGYVRAVKSIIKDLRNGGVGLEKSGYNADLIIKLESFLKELKVK